MTNRSRPFCLTKKLIDARIYLVLREIKPMIRKEFIMEQEKNSIKNFKLIWHYLKDKRGSAVAYVVLLVLTMLPSICTAYIWGLALEALVVKDMMSFTKYITIYTGAFLLFYTFLQIIREMIHNDLEIHFIKSASKDLYKKIDELPAKAFEEMGVGEFINRLSSDTDRVIELLAKMLTMICRIVVVIGIFVVSLFTSWVLALELVVFSVIMGLIANVFFPKIKKEQEKLKEESDKYIKVATENITGIREIKSLGIRKSIEKTINSILDELYKHTRNIRKSETIYYSLNNMTYFILQFVILLTCGYLFYKGNISYSLFIMIEAYIWRIDDVVESLSDFGANYNKVSVSLKRIDELLNNRLYDSEKFGDKALDEITGKIEFKDVSFRYSNDEENTLNGLNLVINPNKKIAIVGRSGNGKSTIFNLLLRYFDATSGKITIDGVGIEELTEESLRSSISIIRQAPYLFNMSIMDNLKLVKEDLTLEEARAVCKKAYIDEYIMSLPNKYETIIGEGGVNLSGGQKQRLAIARTLLLDTKIILFDEATSALDNESQDYIKKTIDDLVKDHTVVIVAHRLSTIVDADVINIIDKGRLVGTGKHSELLHKNDVYKKLYNSEEN